MESKHTTTPWDYHFGEDYSEIFRSKKRSRDITICQLDASYESQANAQFICRAVNSHDDLVEALTHAMTFLESLPKGWLAKTSGDIGALNDFYLTAPEALRKARPSSTDKA